jgi:hypothetical protein
MIDLEAYLRTRAVGVRNAEGGRGWEEGVRVFDCPFCGDAHARGWWTLNAQAAGCFNAGCVAEPRLAGGVVEWVQRRERLGSRGESWRWLVREFSVPSRPTATRTLPPVREDFCRLPPSSALTADSVHAREALAFASRRWGIDAAIADTYGLRACVRDRHAWRIVVPIYSHEGPIAFQTRSFRGRTPKYLTARAGPADDPRAECARRAAQYLYNLERVWPGHDVLLVEGPGDVLGWATRTQDLVAVGLLGVLLTEERIALLRTVRPRRLYVALDAEPAAQQRARMLVEDLEAWEFEAQSGTWEGGKDAGAGARLRVEPRQSWLRHVTTRWERGVI